MPSPSFQLSQADLQLNGRRYAPFERRFCISGVSSASSFNNALVNVATGATPRTLLLVPMTGEDGLVVRQVRINVDGSSAFASNAFAADAALTTGLQFGLFNDSTSLCVDRLWKGQVSATHEWPRANRMLIWATQRYVYQTAAGLTDGAILTLFADFDSVSRGPIFLSPGFSLRVGISPGDTISSGTNIFASAYGNIIPTSA